MTNTAQIIEAIPALSNEDFHDQRAFLEAFKDAGMGYCGVNVFATIEAHRCKEAPRPPRLSHRFIVTSFGDMAGAIRGWYPFTNAYFHPALIRSDIQARNAPTERDIVCVRAFVLDSDADKGLIATPIAGLEPTFIIETSRGGSAQNLHIYYVFDRPVFLEEFKALSELGYRKCGGDPCCQKADQLFRIPATQNHPGWKKVEAGRSPIPQPVRRVGGSGKPMRVEDVRAALEAMPDNSEVRSAAPVGVGAVIDPTTTAGLLARIPARLRELMALEHAPNDPSRDRSKHCAHVCRSLFELGLTDQEVYAVSLGAPFMSKFLNRTAGIEKEIAREREKWLINEKARAEAERTWKAIDKGVPRPAAVELKKHSVGLPRIVNASELQKMEFPPVRFLCDGVLTEGCSVLAGKPKMGKSWWALDLALGIASGSPVMGRDCIQGNVLYCALEDNNRRLQSRIDMISNVIEWPSALDTVTEWGKGEEAIKQFHWWGKKVPNPRLIVVDTLKKIKQPPKGGKGENYADDYDAVGIIQAFSKKTGISILLITHTRKAEADDPFDMVTGTLGVTGSADNILVMLRERSGAITLHGRGRDMEEYSHAVKFDKSQCRWNIVGKAEDFALGDAQKEILDYLRINTEAVGIRDIAEATGLKLANVKTNVYRMLEKRTIVSPFKGKFLANENTEFGVSNLI